MRQTRAADWSLFRWRGRNLPGGPRQGEQEGEKGRRGKISQRAWRSRQKMRTKPKAVKGPLRWRFAEAGVWRSPSPHSRPISGRALAAHASPRPGVWLLGPITTRNTPGCLPHLIMCILWLLATPASSDASSKPAKVCLCGRHSPQQQPSPQLPHGCSVAAPALCDSLPSLLLLCLLVLSSLLLNLICSPLPLCSRSLPNLPLSHIHTPSVAPSPSLSPLPTCLPHTTAALLHGALAVSLFPPSLPCLTTGLCCPRRPHRYSRLVLVPLLP